MRVLKSNRRAGKAGGLRNLTAEQAAKELDPKYKGSGGNYSCRCPAHDDETPSLSITDMVDGGLKAHCFAGCSQEAVVAAIEAKGIAVRSSLAHSKPDATGNIRALELKGWKIAQRYHYRDEDERHLYENVRLELERDGRRHKTFRQRRPTPTGFTESLGDVRRVPYRLHEIVRRIGEDIHITEGEKDADTLGAFRLLSSSVAMSSTIDLSAFKGRRLYIHEDNDRAGREKVLKLGKALSGIAASINVVRYPDAGDGGDVSDWLNADGATRTLEDLLERCEDSPPFAVSDYHDLEKTQAAQIPEEFEALTEVAAARMFEEAETGKRLFEHDRERWFICDEAAIWREDRKRATKRALQDHCVSLNEPSFQSSRKINAVHDLAKTAPCFAVTNDELDPDPDIAGCPMGHIDLKTGNLLKGDPSRKITMSTTVTPAAMPTQIWDRFLMDATGNDKDLIRFLRQYFGYCLSGDTREQCMLFMHGPGGSGKGTLLGTISEIFGDYGWAAPIEAFSSGPDKHPTTFASMRGRRLVTASETEAGRKWAEARLKHITGQDRLNARFCGKDEFQYTPAFKLVISGNHAPEIENCDEAMRRRIHVVPFDRRVAREAADTQLKTKLKAEWPGILQWCIEGGLDWRQNGLVIPEKVRDATAEYFDEQDTFTQWVGLSVTFGEMHLSPANELFRSWERFSKDIGEPPGSAKAFSDKLKKLPGVKRLKSPVRLEDPLSGEKKNFKAYRGLMVK
jgi:putative DNA primase/helicase